MQEQVWSHNFRNFEISFLARFFSVQCAGKNIQMANFFKQFCWRLEEAVQTQFSFAVFALLILLWSFPISQIFESHFWWVFAIWSNCAALVPAGGGGSGGGFFYCLWKRPAASCLTLYFCRNPRKKRLQTRLPRLETAWETGTIAALWPEFPNFVVELWGNKIATKKLIQIDKTFIKLKS